MTPTDTGSDTAPDDPLSKSNLWRELFVALRFSLVGITATAVHILIVWLLLGGTGITPISANTLAFFMAFGISFVGNYVWTFRSPGSPRRVVFRFFLIAAIAFAANTFILAFMVHNGWFSPVVSAIFSASVVPILSFSASRLWGFKEQKDSML